MSTPLPRQYLLLIIRSSVNDSIYTTAKVINRTTTGFAVETSAKQNGATATDKFDQSHGVVINATNGAS